MTVENTNSRRKPYAGNGLTTDFPITFDYQDDADVKVRSVVDATDVETDWVLDGSGDNGFSIVSGEVVANTAPDNGVTLWLYRETSRLQERDLKNNRRTSDEILESGHDQSVLLAQEHDDDLERSFKLPVTADEDVSAELPNPVALSIVRWNSDADGLENVDPEAIVGVSPAGDSVVDHYDDGVDFTAGATTQLTLSVAPATENNTQITFDGVLQHKSSYSLAGDVITFGAAIPGGTSEVEVVISTAGSPTTPANNSVTTAKLVDNSVTNDKMADDSVDTDEIVDDAVTNAKIADDSVNTNEILDNAITNAKMADDSVDSDEIVDGSIDLVHLSDGAIKGINNYEEFTASGTFNVPANVNRVFVFGIGGGGGGGGGAVTHDGAGGGGSCGSLGEGVLLDVTPSGTAAITIGAGGSGGGSDATYGLPGDDGGDTTVVADGITLSFAGGEGGEEGSDAGGAKGAGGANTNLVPLLSCSGGAGSSSAVNGADGFSSAKYAGGTGGAFSVSDGGGGGGGASMFGVGADGGAAAVGTPGDSAGDNTGSGGGGGGAGALFANTGDGGPGGSGKILIAW